MISSIINIHFPQRFCTRTLTWLAVQAGHTHFLGMRGRGGSRQSKWMARGHKSHSTILPILFPHTTQHGSPVAFPGEKFNIFTTTEQSKSDMDNMDCNHEGPAIVSHVSCYSLNVLKYTIIPEKMCQYLWYAFITVPVAIWNILHLWLKETINFITIPYENRKSLSITE